MIKMNFEKQDDQKNTFIITELFAFCSVDEGGEGVIAHSVNGVTMPLIGADQTRVDSLIDLVINISKMTGTKIVLKKFKLIETTNIG